MASLDGIPQFLLITLLTGMIAYYSQILSKSVGKLLRLGHPPEPWRMRVVSCLRVAIWALIVDNLLVIARVCAFLLGRTIWLLDGAVVVAFAVADLMLIAVFCFSYHHESIRSALKAAHAKTH